MKVTGAQIKDFWENGWPDGYYYEPEGMEVDNEVGVFCLDLEETYNLAEFGFAVHNDDWKKQIHFQDAFADYTKSQDVMNVFAVKIPRVQRQALEHFLEEINGFIL